MKTILSLAGVVFKAKGTRNTTGKHRICQVKNYKSINIKSTDPSSDTSLPMMTLSETTVALQPTNSTLNYL